MLIAERLLKMNVVAARIAPPASLGDLPRWGIETAAALTRIAEEAIAPVLAELDPAVIGVYAIGGFGRRELAPFSDLDLLLITDDAESLAPTLAALWRPGLKPSIIVRSETELEGADGTDLLLATSLLDARPLYGRRVTTIEGPPGARRRFTLRRRPSFIEEIARETEERHRRFPGAGFLEPHLRDGRGGLRDLQLRRWLAIVSNEEDASIPQFERISTRDYGILLAGRIILHASLERREDRLLMAERCITAKWLGWADPDSFFREILLAMKRTASPPRPPATGEEAEVSALALRRRLERCVVDGRAAEPFSAWLRRRDADGTIARLLPEWSRIECLANVDPIHRHTPEEHTLRTIEEIESLLEKGNGPVAPEMIPRPDLLVLAALLHDIAKGDAGEHAADGARIARTRAAEWGYDAVDAATIGFLVENHLLLSYHAFFRDIDEPALIHSLAERFENVGEVAMLHLLTVADLKAVSPDMYTEWKGRLLRTLTARLLRQCMHRLPPEHIAREAIARRRGAVENLMAAEGRSAEIERHFATIDARYALAHSPDSIARHIRLLPRLAATPVVAERSHLPGLGATEIVVVTASHRGLFAEIAGTLAARGLNILGADISTRVDEIAIDTFRVADHRDATLLDDDRWNSLAEDLRQVLTGTLSVDTLLARRRPYLDRGPGRPGAVPAAGACRMTVDRESSRTHAIVEITAPDEIGLLHRIATAFRDCGVGISSAIVTTSGGAAADVFYVTTDAGDKDIPPETLAAIERKLVASG